jgi:hypothetical protein
MSSCWPSRRGFAGYSTQSKTIQLTWNILISSSQRWPGPRLDLEREEKQHEKLLSPDPSPPPTSGGCGHLAGSGQPALGGGGEGCGLPPGHRSQTRTWLPGRPCRAYSGHICWPPFVAAHMLPQAPRPSKVQTAEEAIRHPPAARMPAARMPGRLESRRPWMTAAGMPTARMPAARMLVHLAPFCKEGGPDIKRGPAGHDAGRPIKRRPRAGRRWRLTGLYPSSPHLLSFVA